MKGIKKLFALVVVLALALTLTPVLTTNAQDSTTMAVENVEWITEQEAFGADVNENSSTTDVVLKIQGRIDGVNIVNTASFTFDYGNVNTVEKSSNNFTVYVYYNEIFADEDGVYNLRYQIDSDNELTASFPLRLFKVEADVPSEVTSGDEVTITGTVAPLEDSLGLVASNYKVFVWTGTTQVASAAISTTGTFSLTFTASGNAGTNYNITVQGPTTTSYNGAPYYTISVMTPSEPEPELVSTILEYSASRWVKVGGQWLYQVDYNVYNAPINAQNMVVRLKSGTQVLGESALNFRQVSAPFSVLWNALGGKDGTVKLVLENSTASTVVPVTFFNVESELKGSYVSGEPVNKATGTITTVAGNVNLVASEGVIPMALIGVWEDADGNTYSTVLESFSATISSDQKTATFAFAANAFKFTVPAGKVYLVSGNIAEGVVDGEFNGIAVEKFAYKTIEIKQAKFTVNPETITLPPFDKEVYVYDQFGPVKNTKLKVEFGYKVTATQDAAPIEGTTDENGKLTLGNIPKPANYGTYTATLSTVVGGNAVVDGVAVLHVSYGAQLVLSESIIHTSTIHQLGTIKINVESSGSPIKKLWIDVADPNNVLTNFYAPTHTFHGAELWVESPFIAKKDTIEEGPCNVEKTVDKYWFAEGEGASTATLYGTAVQGGTITVTATAELADGSLAVATKEYVVKAYRIASISPASMEYDTSGTVKVVVKDWYNGYADGVNVQLVARNPYNQVGPNQFTLIPENFGTYSFTIPAGAVPGRYAVKINGVDYSVWSGKYFSVAPIPDLKVTAPATVNAMAKFDVSVTDKSGNVVNGTWSIEDQLEGSVVNGKFSVDTAAFVDGSLLGDYPITIITSDGKHSGSAVVSIVAPSTITPTAVVTHGFKSTVVVTMTSTAFNASLIDLAVKTYSSLDKVTFDKVYSAQTATVVVKVLKSDMCSGEPKLTLKYGNFVLDNGALKIAHPQLSFVKTATWYAKDIVPMQVKLVDALGNPIEGAVVRISQLGYFELTATTNAEGIADFGNVTLNAAGNVVAELIYNPELEEVVDYRLFGQTDNTSYKVIAQVEPARPAQDLNVTVTPTIVDAGKDALLTLNLVGADGKPVETGKSVVVTIGPTTYNGLVGANGVVTFTVRSESLTGTVVTGVVKVEGYNAATFTLAVKPAEEPGYKTIIELAPGMDIYTVNGQTRFWDATPYIKNGRTMVPIRHLAEVIGLKADWDFSDPANKMVFIYTAEQDPEKDKEHPFILLIIGQPTAMVSGNLVALDVAPEILNGRTMVPLRFVVETLGYKVEWLGNTIRLMK